MTQHNAPYVPTYVPSCNYLCPLSVLLHLCPLLCPLLQLSMPPFCLVAPMSHLCPPYVPSCNYLCPLSVLSHLCPPPMSPPEITFAPFLSCHTYVPSYVPPMSPLCPLLQLSMPPFCLVAPMSPPYVPSYVPPPMSCEVLSIDYRSTGDPFCLDGSYVPSWCQPLV